MIGIVIVVTWDFFGDLPIEIRVQIYYETTKLFCNNKQTPSLPKIGCNYCNNCSCLHIKLFCLNNFTVLITVIALCCTESIDYRKGKLNYVLVCLRPHDNSYKWQVISNARLQLTLWYFKFLWSDRYLDK